MPELEGGARGGRERARRGETAWPAQSELLMERAVGEPLQALHPEGETESLLRPQQGRNYVWRWHVRRRQRSR